jgi:hypothetical protein
MQYSSPIEIFPLMKDELNSKLAQKVYRIIMETYNDVGIVSLRNCISIAVNGENYRKFATISTAHGNALLLHYPLEVRENIIQRQMQNQFKNEFEISKLYGNQINIPFENIHNVEEIKELIDIAYKNPRYIRNTLK